MATRMLPVLDTGNELAFNPNTVLIYEGPSRIDGQPIVVLMTGLERGSTNRKTGGMIQTYILRADMTPMEALWTGADKSICGGCPLRPNKTSLKQGKLHRACYVQVGQAPMSLFRAHERGRYRRIDLTEATEMCSERIVRLGAYGDPAAVPIEVWDAVLKEAAGHTGYTHQWKARRFAALKRYCQASVDSDAERERAAAAGWGTFQVRAEGNVLEEVNQHLCPASKEAGHRTTCEQCLRCGGTTAADRFGAPQHIMIPAHGAGAGHIKEVA